MKRTTHRTAKANYCRSADTALQPTNLTDAKHLGKGVQDAGMATTLREYTENLAD